ASNTYNPSALVTFTAKVIDPTGTGTPSGTVDIYNTINYDLLTSDATLNSSGIATFGPLELSNFYNYPTGTTSVPYSLGVGYSGDSTYPSTDSGYLLGVVSELTPTTLSISPSTTSPALGSNITVTATLSIVASGPPAGSVAPSGSITLTVNGTALNPVALTTA